MKDGILIVDKPEGIPSFGIIKKIRKLNKNKKTGHLGTLDPLATGVLPVMIGKATRLAKFFDNSTKTYMTKMILGYATDSQDITGNITHTHSDIPCNDAIISCINSFCGEIEQVPPMASAVKVNGKRLYKYFRENVTVERKTRAITIFSIEPIDISRTDQCCVTFQVHCSKGTYIRTLCDDIGKKLGCFATLSSLRRIQNGPFSIDNAYTLDNILSFSEEKINSCIVPLIDILHDLPILSVEENEVKDVYNGCILNNIPDHMNHHSHIRIVYDNSLLGIYKKHENILKADVIFHYD